MSKKVNNKKTNSQKNLSSKKNPSNELEHWSFSISKDASGEKNYKDLNKKRTYREKIMELSDDKGSEEKEKKNLLIEQKKETSSKKLNIRKTNTNSSPYVVNLLRKENKEKKEKEDSKENFELDWLKDTKKLRKITQKKFKRKSNALRVDLLKNAKKTGNKISFLDLPKKIVSLPFLFVAWIFELLLSLPLGILLLLQLVLKIIEHLYSLLKKITPIAGNSVSFLFEESILIVAALGRGIIITPIKVIGLFFAALFKLVGFVYLGFSLFFRSIKDNFKIFIKILTSPPSGIYKKILAVLILSFLTVSSAKLISQTSSDLKYVKGKVLGATQEGFGLLGDVDLSSENALAFSDNFDKADLRFQEAKDSLNSLNLVIRGIIKLTPQGSDGVKALNIGENLAKAGEYISSGITPFVVGENAESNENLLAKINKLSESFTLALPYLLAAQSDIESINIKSVPEEFRPRFTKAKQTLPGLTAAVGDFKNLASSFVDILGGNGFKRYAILFQNNNELRPAGGFIGSLALVDFIDGQITNIEIPGGGTYDFQGYLTEQITSPKPLWLVNSAWQLQDANWYPDWPTSAEKISWFIEKSGHSSIDGVIALQATTLEKLLAITGPIDFPEQEVVLSSENVLQEIQTAVEIDYDKEENKPKKYIAELAPKVTAKVLNSNSDELLGLLGLIKGEVLEKNILVYFKDKSINKKFQERNWQPKILDNDLDYLSVIHANIGGGKTDGVIKESWLNELEINELGDVVARLTITRQHNGDKDDIFTSYNNVDFVRVYAPQGSELISATGFKPPGENLFETPGDDYGEDTQLSEIEGSVFIDEKTKTRINNEFGKTVFGNWIQVDPGNTAVSTFEYKLPFKIAPHDILNPDKKNGYSLLLQKQPGARAIPYNIDISYPGDWEVVWKKVNGIGTLDSNGLGKVYFQGVLNKDSGFALLFGNKNSE